MISIKIIKEYKEDGYIVCEFDNGFIKKILISDFKEITQDIPIITQQEIINAQIINDLEYLKCMTELNSMKGGNL